jgi:hypothetical protein
MFCALPLTVQTTLLDQVRAAPRPHGPTSPHAAAFLRRELQVWLSEPCMQGQCMPCCGCVAQGVMDPLWQQGARPTMRDPAMLPVQFVLLLPCCVDSSEKALLLEEDVAVLQEHILGTLAFLARQGSNRRGVAAKSGR